MAIKQHYHSAITTQGFFEDPEQAAAVDAFQQLYDELLLPPPAAPDLLGRFLKTATTAPPTGLYLWGGPGRGKTYLMDLFYHHLPIEQKQRLHFHHFMQNIHAELAAIKNQREPLALIAAGVAEKTRILCLDEFYVSDIGDAMLLAGLLKALFENSVVLVTTSNTLPENLYRNGLQRERFLPAIALIKQHTQLIKMHQGDDYRLENPGDSTLTHYQICTADEADGIIAQQYQQLTGKRHCEAHDSLQIRGRNIPVIAQEKALVWFDFDTLCVTARSTGDYLDIAQRYSHVMITHIPIMDEALDNAAIRFIHLIDALYDRKVKLFTTATVTPERLYCGTHHIQSFKRAASRLNEMRHSSQYLDNAPPLYPLTPSRL